MGRLLLGIVVLLAALPASAANYDVRVTRRDSNLYEVQGKDIYILTRYCYEYVYHEDALLRMHGTAGEIVFLDQGGKCDVEGVYAKADIGPGSYELSVSHEDDDWYEAWGTDSFIRTEMCLSLALVQDALLRVNAYGGGTLVFLDDGDSCTVEGVYSKLRL